MARKTGNIARVPILIGTVANDGLLFVLGENDTKSYLQSAIPNESSLYSAILDAYPIGAPGIESAQDQIAAIETEVRFQCPTSVVAQDSHQLGLPTWRYYYNASFPNMALFPGSEVYHSSEVALVFGTYPRVNATALEARTSQYLQTSWTAFAKNPSKGPGWNPLPNIVALGSPGEPISLDISASAIDGRCGLYTGYYTKLGTVA